MDAKLLFLFAMFLVFFSGCIISPTDKLPADLPASTSKFITSAQDIGNSVLVLDCPLKFEEVNGVNISSECNYINRSGMYRFRLIQIDKQALFKSKNLIEGYPVISKQEEIIEEQKCVFENLDQCLPSDAKCAHEIIESGCVNVSIPKKITLLQIGPLSKADPTRYQEYITDTHEKAIEQTTIKCQLEDKDVC